MSEVSLEAESGKAPAEDPRVDCEDADVVEQDVREEVKVVSEDHGRNSDVSEDVMYDIDIDSPEESGDKYVEQEDEGEQSGSGVRCADGDPALRSGSVGSGRPHTSEANGDSHTGAKVTFTVFLFG